MEENITWTPITYTYHSELAERIALTQLQTKGTAENQVGFTIQAYKTLNLHLSKISDYMTKVRDGQLPFDPILMRKCADIASFWRGNTDPQHQTEITQANLSLCVSYLAEGITALQQIMN